MTRQRADTSVIPTSAPGVLAFPAPFEHLIARLRTAIDQLGLAEPFVSIQGPPVIDRAVLERAGYVAVFPHLLGTVHTFQDGPDAWRPYLSAARRGGDWHRLQRLTDVAVTPAPCYHVYAMLADAVLPDDARYEIEAPCYRHETSYESGRLRSFRIREFVRLGSAQDCRTWRDDWRSRAGDWLAGLGLDVEAVVATDPFFGPAERMMRASQLEQALKIEFVAPLANGVRQAVASVNLHHDHFGDTMSIKTPGGATAHSACTGFGLERIALAVLHAHGDRWEAVVP